MTKPTQLTFWFEFASPYSYLSAMRIRDLADRAGVTVIWQPFLLGPIFAAQGWDDSPFRLYPRKGAYMLRDMVRTARDYGLPYAQPDIFPQNGLLAARVALALRDAGHDPAAFVCSVYARQFAQNADISDPATIAAALGDAALPDDSTAEVWISRAQSPQIKQALRDAGTRADRLGLFGAPSFSTGDEIFWGDDRLEQALRYAQV